MSQSIEKESSNNLVEHIDNGDQISSTVSQNNTSEPVGEVPCSSGSNAGSSESPSHAVETNLSGYHVCLVCNKSFIRKHDLKRHQLIHTGTKPFTCGDCGKSFTQKIHLTIHQRIHSGS